MATVTRENIGLLNDKIIVRVAKEDYLSSFEKSLKTYSKNANIPGFRKGMVPTGMIKKMHGQAVFTDEVLKTVEKELTNYMQNEKLDIFAQPLPLPENDARQIDMNKPDEYAFAFEVGLKPEFTLPDLSALNLPFYKVEVTDAMVDEEVERLQLRHGKMLDPEDVTGDKNVINVTFIEIDQDGKEVEGGIRKDNSLLVSYFAPAFRETLLGKKKDDVVTVELTQAFEEKERSWVMEDMGLNTSAEDHLAKRFNMQITKVGLVEKAEMNEEFFKTAFPAKEIESEEAFRQTVKAEIQAEWDKQGRNQLQHEIYHRLLDETRVEFPDSFLKKVMQNNGEQVKSPEEVENEYPSFSNQLKWSLITQRIISENNIEVAPDDIAQFAKMQLFGYMGLSALDEEQPWMTEYVGRMMKDRKFVEDTYHRLQTEKVFEWAQQQAQATDKPISVEDFVKLQKEHEHHHHN